LRLIDQKDSSTSDDYKLTIEVKFDTEPSLITKVKVLLSAWQEA
jgi:hypothetical protein